MSEYRLRTMAMKSVFTTGKYHGWSVEKVIKNVGAPYIKYIYYAVEKVSFTDEVLDACFITERIPKPGIDKDKLYPITSSVDRTRGKSIDDLKKEMQAKRLNGQNFTYVRQILKEKQVRQAQAFTKELYTKAALQGKNLYSKRK